MVRLEPYPPAGLDFDLDPWWGNIFDFRFESKLDIKRASLLQPLCVDSCYLEEGNVSMLGFVTFNSFLATLYVKLFLSRHIFLDSRISKTST